MSKHIITDKETWDRLLESSNILAESLQTYQSDNMVEVVRCKDCRYGPKSLREGVCVNAWCGMWVKEDDFCSYGERRSGI